MQRLRGWFTRERKKALEQAASDPSNPSRSKAVSNPFASMMKELRKPQEPMPRAISKWQYYMSHPDHRADCDAEFKRRGGEDMPASKHLNFRRQVAEELLSLESETTQKSLVEEAAEKLKEELEEYHERQEGLPSCDPGVQEECV